MAQNQEVSSSFNSNINVDFRDKYESIKTQIFMFSSNNVDYDLNFLVGVFTTLIKHHYDKEIIKHINALKTIIERIEAIKPEDARTDTIIALEAMAEANSKIIRAFNNVVLDENETVTSMSHLQKIKSKLINLNNKEIIENGMRSDANTKFSSLNDCFTFLIKEIEDLEKNAREKEEYYSGNSKEPSVFYWTIGWLSWAYNRCKYKTMAKSYNKFLNLCITPLNDHISRRKREFDMAIEFFGIIQNEIEELLEVVKNTELNPIRLELFVSNFDTNIVTLYEHLRIRRRDNAAQ